VARITLRMFAGARQAAGTASAEFDAGSVGEVVSQAVDRFGPEFERIVAASRIWLNGEAVEGDEPVGEGDEVAVLPPVSGG